MTKTEYLSQAVAIGRHIAIIEKNIRLYREVACSPIGLKHSAESVNKSHSNSPAFEKMMLNIFELEEKLESLIEQYDTLCAEIMLLIESLSNEEYKTLMLLRYLHGLHWDLIASRLYISRVTAYRWHNQALAEIKVPE